jgi:RNA polymerase sigma-70 factor (ECF subfamily)
MNDSPPRPAVELRGTAAAPATAFAATGARTSPADADVADTPDDDALMERAAAGDRHAFGLLVERHRDRMVGYLSRLTGDRDRAEDLAQETFVRLFRAAPDYTPQGQLPAYLYRIATNLLRSEERRARVTRWLSLDLSSEEALEPRGSNGARIQEDAFLNGELQRRLTAALAGMPLRLRVPLVLHEIEDWPIAKIAEVTGAREGTVKSRLSRGRKELRQRIEPYWTGGQP